MKKIFSFIFVSILISPAFGQNNSKKIATKLARPKLVVGLVVDQMRWDYLYRFHDLYAANGGFRRLLGEGFSCENTFIPYMPTVTAAGHTCIYTGSVPAIHGIVGNDWFDNLTKQYVYCTSDTTVETLGSDNSKVGENSPRNMFATTIGDELRLATNFKSKVVGIACKDRASILPAGHNPTAAYWYDAKSGNFVSSTYYMDTLPDWVENFNGKHRVDSLYTKNWDLVEPKSVYEKYASETDQNDYEATPITAGQNSFPYNLTQFIGKDYGKIMYTPYANTLTADMAIAALKGENLGKGETTDMLAISFSSPDYIGHAQGPNSWEQLDDYLRLDKEIERVLNALDAQVGRGNYTVFLSADHGAAHAAGYSIAHKMPGGVFDGKAAKNDMNEQLKQKYGFGNIIKDIMEYQVILNDELLSHTENINREDLTNWIINYLIKKPEVASAFAFNKLSQTILPEVQKQRITNGYFAQRCGQIQIILKPGYFDGSKLGTTHGEWNPYDSHIPLVFYGWGIKTGSTNRETYMTDIAATLAGLLHIQMPSGCIGNVVTEALEN
ncbi:alkaline phosphatase PafA [Rhizosphaericola mali]|uniref:Alkaline phosphatase family protein n=1 Tax=Rhizosphaericola mali TaxID=2545455 RepID=A0A5P2G0A0_9BACT|nr:alkaline phosphatase PafA [Rhizosphaericola mali]QES87252.1 alkaline phosphatase family protein [Rhizosphaericola mali]